MSANEQEPPHPDRRQVPAWFERVSKLSWGFVGIAAATGAVVLMLAALRELVIPLVLAAFFATVFASGVDWLEKRKIPRSAGAIVVLLAITLAIWGAIAVVVIGVIDQADELSERIDEAQVEINNLIRQSDFNDLVEQIRQNAGDGSALLGDGIGSTIGTVLNSATGFVSGLVLGLVLLYYLLKDGRELVRRFIVSRSQHDSAQYQRIVAHAGRSIRGYFKGKTVLAAAQGAFITVITALMGVPLPGSIGVVNFIGAYIPFLGAFLGGAFAMLMALSEGGLVLALATLGVVVFMNVVLENVLEPKLLGSSLKLHPIIVLLSTVAGGVVAGLVGLVLAAPITSIGINLYKELRSTGFFDEDRDAPVELSPDDDLPE